MSSKLDLLAQKEQ
jgi:hypothetical protein